MGRTRTIDRDEILDAAVRIVMREGASGLSIDAVAKEAGVSKSTVLYDHKTKSALLEALVDRQVKSDMKHIEGCISASQDTPHPELFGRIAACEAQIEDADRAVATAITASVSNDENLQKLMRDWTNRDLDAMAAGPRYEAARMAYFALMGFYATELFGFQSWPQGERKQLLDDIRSIYFSFERSS
ncbi:TetR/AcrR family transcriptional regulator [Oryzifoliimicrobium ureilyticus]|uniref:TetR/AcrR family transcriptional regulator n=1 Tax=Oryzifoliimicrobium ureilyticus TaxID=3113724 RepID=UPI0030762675